jgi:predicted porin
MRFRSPLVIAGAVAMLLTGVARADEASDLKAKFEELQKQMETLKQQLDQVNAQLKKQQEEQAKAAAAGGGAVPFLKKKEGDPITFITPGGEVTLYGHVNLSIDDTTKGLQGETCCGGASPLGRVGWMPALSSNLSYIGVRGFQKLIDDLRLVYQFETQIDITASSGVTETNSNNSNVVKGALTTRDSFVGVADKSWGSVKIGKTDAPYKKSTGRFDPFNGMIGSYSVVMGNTGGDNRVEFGTRIDKAVWYESPTFEGLSGAILWSPSQNRSLDNSNIASGESDCAGGNAPGSGALPPACNDGSFGTAYSASISYDVKPLYVTGAWEFHDKVNRISDQPILAPQPPGVTLYPAGYPFDIGNEYAWKVGVMYTLPTDTTIGGIWEEMRRSVPAPLQIQNERSRNGFWLTGTQKVTAKDTFSVGWAHAFATPGDPGQHNTSGNLVVDSATGVFGNPNPDNSANMFTAAWKHHLTKSFMVYADWAETLNHPLAHYDLGAGGRGVTTDCHDATLLAAFDATTGTTSFTGPHCWAGGHLQGVSIGMDWVF